MFYPQIAGIFIIIVLLGLCYSLMSYLTFGSKITSLIIYNLDDRDRLSIICKCLYMFTIAGIYVLVLVPALNLFE
jgi:hypothetical protein